MREDIFAAASALVKPAQTECELLRTLCDARALELERQLRAQVSKDDCAATFICAAGWLAAADLEDVRCAAEELSSVRAGDMIVTAASASERRERTALLRRQASRLMEPYCEGGFFFCGVQG